MTSHAEHAPTDAGVPRSLALVMNAQAGALLAEDGGAGTLEQQLRADSAGLQVIPADAGSLPERVAQAVATGSSCVVVAGGDGTIACAAQALAGTGTALGLIPCGTMNLLARDLGLDPDDRAASVRLLAEGRERAIDVGEVSGAGDAGHVFLCASMIGTPARLSRHREAGRERGNGVLAWARFALAAMRALAVNRSMRLGLRVDGVQRQVRTPSLTITVNRLEDDSGRLFGRSCLDGGRLAVYLVHRNSALAQAGLLLRTAWHGNLRTPQIEVIDAGEVEVQSRHAAIHVLVDGELRLLKPPLRYTIRPAALRVIGAA